MTAEALVRFIDLLRCAGVSVSTSALLSAAEAVRLVSLADRGQVRHALGAALVRSSADLAVFNRLFDIVFAADDGDGDGDGGAVAGADRGADLRLALAAGDTKEVNRIIRAAAAEYAAATPGRAFPIDYHLRRMLRTLGLEGAVALAGEALIADRLHPGEDHRSLLNVDTELRRALEQNFADRQDLNETARMIGTRKAENFDFLRLQPGEAAELRRTTQALGRRLAARMARRRHRNLGRADLRATIGRSRATGGVPFEVRRVVRRRHRPDVLVLADVSGSVATFARFTLHLLHSVSSAFQSIRIMAFVDEIDDVTERLRRTDDFEQAIEDILDNARTLGESGHSDYGAALAAFNARWPTAVRSTTTVLILGDARNNYHAVNAGQLAAIRKRARKVYWLNPEPGTYWDTADSVIGKYAEHCDEVLECRNLWQLQRAVGALG